MTTDNDILKKRYIRREFYFAMICVSVIIFTTSKMFP